MSNSQETPALLACPYSKRDPEKHRKCFKYEMKRIKDVKQHLIREHKRPLYCSECIAIFDDEKDRDHHIRARQCEPRPLAEIPGMTKKQEEDVSKRSKRGSTNEENWLGMWEVLFPGVPQPDSIYKQQLHPVDMACLLHHVTTQGEPVLRACFDSLKATIVPSSPSEGVTYDNFQDFVFREVKGQLCNLIATCPSSLAFSTHALHADNSLSSQPGPSTLASTWDTGSVSETPNGNMMDLAYAGDAGQDAFPASEYSLLQYFDPNGGGQMS